MRTANVVIFLVALAVAIGGFAFRFSQDEGGHHEEEGGHVQVDLESDEERDGVLLVEGGHAIDEGVYALRVTGCGQTEGAGLVLRAGTDRSFAGTPANATGAALNDPSDGATCGAPRQASIKAGAWQEGDVVFLCADSGTGAEATDVLVELVHDDGDVLDRVRLEKVRACA